MAKYYVDDIVEIITAQYNNWDDIPACERGYFENQNTYAPTRGQRFRVVMIDTTYKNEIRLYGSYKLGLSAITECVMLYKRPLKNKIKALFDRGEYA